MTQEAFSRIENDLRNAVRLRRYAEVERLAQLFSAAAVNRVRSLAPGDAERANLVRHAEEVLEWSRMMVSAARASTADELRHLPFVKRYLPSGESRRSNVRLDG